VIGGVVTSSVIGRQIRKRAHVEDDLQRAICHFLQWALPADAVYFAVPNGGLRSPRVAARMRATGTRAGVPDLCIIHRGHALFIELKAAHGTMSAVQKEMARRLIYAGAEVMLCRSLEDVERSLREAGVHLRGTVQ
jgi:hypothetical protein